MSDADRAEGPEGSSRSQWSPGSRVDGPGRLEVHNASVDEQLADEGVCARIHLASGRVCLLAHNHAGSCDFVAPDDRQ